MRSFEELGPEFAEGVDLPPDEASRREFLKLLGASVALSGLAGCTRAPREKIVPYTTQPPEVTPGIPNHYATAMTIDGYAIGVVVESHEGRPTKIEGNPGHPSSLGATSAIEQAAVLELYDPSRARALHQQGQQRGWRAFFDTFGADTSQRAYAGSGQGEGLHVLMEPTTSPLAVTMIERLRKRFPRAKVHFFAPPMSARTEAWEGNRLACGRVLETQYDLRKAKVVVALDADFLGTGACAVRDARHLAERRRVRATTDEMSRLYVVESALGITGGYADHRLRVRRSDVRAIAAGLLAEVMRVRGQDSPLLAPLDRIRHRGAHETFIAAMARDLVEHARESVVLTSSAQPREVHAIAHLIDVALGNIGQTKWLTESAIFEAGEPSHGLGALLEALDRKEVDTLVVLDGNPCYTAPADLELARRVRQARERIYLGLYENETAREATWFVPAAHWLEQWSVTRSYDGTTSIVQPLLEPLHGGRTPSEVLAALTGERTPEAHSLVRELFRTAGSFPDFETAWESALQKGIVEKTSSVVVEIPVQTADESRVGAYLESLPVADSDGGLEIGFSLDMRVRDGRFTNNAWLLELPDPITKLTWENALSVSASTAKRLGVESEDVVELTLRGRVVTVPVLVMPGHADESVTLALGYGRTGAEAIARGLGTNAYALQSDAAPRFDVGVVLRKLGRRQALARTQQFSSMEGRDPVRRATVVEYRNEPRFAREEEDQPKPQLYKLPLAPGAPGKAAALGNNRDQWAMSIDLSICNGCSACVVACQAENNTPIVGKQGVLQSREMHWMRLDRYFEGDDDHLEMLVQPMLCQHCESAPCEYVCPVNATVHSPDGINEQVYNRCVGTRFCSNNCPYKVRRFNWFDYHEQAIRGGTPQTRELRQMVLNPDVTVRARGVMEKCTFCVQRVRENEIHHRIDGARSKEGEVQTACQQACPTTAIVFGSLTWKDAEVVQRRENERAYGVLSELGTEPRVHYLARLRNENTKISGESTAEEPAKK